MEPSILTVMYLATATSSDDWASYISISAESLGNASIHTHDSQDYQREEDPPVETIDRGGGRVRGASGY